MKVDSLIIVSICLVNIISSFVLNKFFEETPCISCILTVLIFILILVSYSVYTYIESNKYFFYALSTFLTITGIYLILNKILYTNKSYIFDIKSCTGGIDDYFDIKNILSTFLNNINIPLFF